MTFSASTLSTQLKALALYDDESNAISGWTDAFSVYFEGAMSNGLPISGLALPVAETAMKAAMVGKLATDGASALQLGILAFWGALVPATAWTTVTVIAPPILLSGLGAALTTTFSANVIGKLSANDSMTAIAATINLKNQGGLATWPSPVGAVAIT